MDTLLSYLSGNLANKYIKTEDGWRKIETAIEGHRAFNLFLEDGVQLRVSLWARVEIADQPKDEAGG